MSSDDSSREACYMRVRGTRSKSGDDMIDDSAAKT